MIFSDPDELLMLGPLRTILKIHIYTSMVTRIFTYFINLVLLMILCVRLGSTAHSN